MAGNKEELIKDFIKEGLKAVNTIGEIKIISTELPHLMELDKLINFLIDRTEEITIKTMTEETKEKLKLEIIEGFKEDLELLQYRITEITTHHQTNKRKNDLRKIVKRTFPYLNLGESQKYVKTPK